MIDVDNDESADAIEVIEIEQDEEKSKDAAAAVLAELAPKEMGESLEKEKSCIAASRNVAQNILEALSNYRAQGWSSAAVHDMRVREAKSLVDNTVLPNFSVVTVGNTGAGKCVEALFYNVTFNCFCCFIIYFSKKSEPCHCKYQTHVRATCALKI